MAMKQTKGQIAVVAAWLLLQVLWTNSAVEATDVAATVAVPPLASLHHVRRRQLLKSNTTQVASNELNTSPTAAPSVLQTPAPTTIPPDGGYPSVVYMLWYMSAMLCCVIPAFCAYRRRQVVQEPPRETFYPTVPLDAAHASAAALNEGTFSFKYISPTIKRTKRLQAALAATSRTLTADDFVAADTSVELKTSRLDSEDIYQSSLWIRLPSGSIGASGEAADDQAAVTATTSRLVPAVCTICLGAYQVDESVSWSSSSPTSTAVACIHAFHSDCIVAWLAKKNDASCPVCRQEFCVPALLLAPQRKTTSTTIPITALESPSAAAATAATTASTAIPITTLESPSAAAATTATDAATHTIFLYPSTEENATQSVNITIEEHRL
jgi:Ring finger domain